MNKLLGFILVVIIIAFNLIVASSLLLLYIRIGGTERWEGYPGQEKGRKVILMETTEPPSDKGESAIFVHKAPRQPKTLSPYPSVAPNSSYPQQIDGLEIP